MPAVRYAFSLPSQTLNEAFGFFFRFFIDCNENQSRIWINKRCISFEWGYNPRFIAGT